jgi:hypothetical protein
MSKDEFKEIWQIYEFLCDGRVFMARERLEMLLQIQNKEKA